MKNHINTRQGENDMPSLSKRQAEIVGYISNYRRRKGYAPTFREIAAGIGVSLSTAMAHLRALKGKGYIAWDYGTARSIRVI
jgi:repressor LexA